jgi:6-phosphogluconolactonase
MNYLRHCFSSAGFLVLSFALGCSNAISNNSPVTTTPPTSPTTPTAPSITAKAKFAYTGNQGASLSGYAVDPSSGALTSLKGFPVLMGLNPTVISHDPQNRFLIVGDIASSQLHVFAIDSTTGSLAEVQPSPYLTVKEPVALITDPAGTHVYVASQGGNQVGAYNLSSAGVLTSIEGGPFSTGSTEMSAHTVGAAGIVMDASGKFLHVQDLANLYTFSIDSNSGALTLLQTVPGPNSGGAIALDPAGNYLYGVGAGTNSILTYSINAASGLLTQVKSSAMVEQNGAYTISVSPTGQFAYTIENNNDLVSYVISNGGFTPVGKVYLGVYGEQIAVDPSGSFVYVPQACSNCPSGTYNVVHEFSIGSTGALTPLSGSTVAAGVTPWGITVTSQ